MFNVDADGKVLTADGIACLAEEIILPVRDKSPNLSCRPPCKRIELAISWTTAQCQVNDAILGQLCSTSKKVLYL